MNFLLYKTDVGAISKDENFIKLDETLINTKTSFYSNSDTMRREMWMLLLNKKSWKTLTLWLSWNSTLYTVKSQYSKYIEEIFIGIHSFQRIYIADENEVYSEIIIWWKKIKKLLSYFWEVVVSKYWPTFCNIYTIKEEPERMVARTNLIKILHSITIRCSSTITSDSVNVLFKSANLYSY